MSVQVIDPSDFSITITEQAQQHLISQIVANKSSGVRLVVKPSGCAGFAYNWDVVSVPDASDILVTEFADYTLYTNEISKQYLDGSTIELKQEGIQGSHLEVVSPRAVDACGCGESIRFN